MRLDPPRPAAFPLSALLHGLPPSRLSPRSSRASSPSRPPLGHRLPRHGRACRRLAPRRRAPLLLPCPPVDGRPRPPAPRPRPRRARPGRGADPARRRRHPPAALGAQGLRLGLTLRSGGEDEEQAALRLRHYFVCLGLLVRLPCPSRPLFLPVLFRLWLAKDGERTKPKLAREVVEFVAVRHPERRIALVGDAACATAAYAACGSESDSRKRRGEAACAVNSAHGGPQVPPPQILRARGAPATACSALISGAVHAD